MVRFLINSVELEIGGQKIDKHTGDWMETWAELTEPNPSGVVTDAQGVTGTLFQNMSGMGGYDSAGANSNQLDNGKLFIPLFFWFCRNPGLALPLIALQYHEVKVILDHRITAIVGTGDTKLWCDYIYLDTDERRRFAQVSHEYLIEQVQEQSVTGLDTGAELNFNHPVKELIWFASVATATAGGIPIKNSRGVIKNPPPTPNIPERIPTSPPSPNNKKAFIETSAMGR